MPATYPHHLIAIFSKSRFGETNNTNLSSSLYSSSPRTGKNGSLMFILLHNYVGDLSLLECLTVCKALSLADAKGKGIDFKGWAFRML